MFLHQTRKKKENKLIKQLEEEKQSQAKKKKKLREGISQEWKQTLISSKRNKPTDLIDKSKSQLFKKAKQKNLIVFKEVKR